MNRTCTWGAAAVIVFASLYGGTAQAQPPSENPSAKAKSPPEDRPSKKKEEAKPAKQPAEREPAAQRERLRRARQRLEEGQRAERPGRGSEGRKKTGKGSPPRPTRGMKKGAGRRMQAKGDDDSARGRGLGKRMGRRQVWKRLRQHWPADVISPALTAEMRRHARRMAKLDRIGELAQKQNDEKTLRRVKALLERERERHRRKVEVLSKAARASGAGSPPSKKKATAGDEEGR